MRLGRTTFLHFVSHVAISLTGFAATLAIARFGGAELLGLYAPAVALAFWFNIPATAVGDALSKRLSEGRDHGTFLASALLLEVSIAAVFAVVVLVGSARVDRLVGAEVGDLVALLVVGNVLFITVRSVLNGEKKVAQAAGTKSFERVVRSLLQIGAVVAGFGVVALVAGHAVALFVGTLAAAYVTDAVPTRPTRASIESLLEYARYSWLSTLKTRAFTWMDTLFLAFFAVGSTLIGIYEAAWSLASMFALVAISVKSTLFPEMSELGTEDAEDRIQHYLNEGLVFTGVFIIPGLFGAAVLGERVLRIYRPEFTQGAPILVILVFARMLAAYGEQLLNVVNAVDRPDIAFRVNATFAGSNVVFNLVLVATYGWVGAAVATALSAGLGLVLSYVSLSRVVGRPDVPVAEIGRQVLAAVAMAVAVAVAAEAAPTGNFVTIGLALAGAVFYTVSLVAVSQRVRSKTRGLIDDTLAQ
jgi:O-antigen/teichoic acid export membrane protein